MNMIQNYLVLSIVAFALFRAAAANQPTQRKTARQRRVKTGVTPFADPEIAVIEMENSSAYGTIKLELYSNIAPKMVAQFKELAKEGVYDGIDVSPHQSVGDPRRRPEI